MKNQPQNGNSCELALVLKNFPYNYTLQQADQFLKKIEIKNARILLRNSKEHPVEVCLQFQSSADRSLVTEKLQMLRSFHNNLFAFADQVQITQFLINFQQDPSSVTVKGQHFINSVGLKTHKFKLPTLAQYLSKFSPQSRPYPEKQSNYSRYSSRDRNRRRSSRDASCSEVSYYYRDKYNQKYRSRRSKSRPYSRSRSRYNNYPQKQYKHNNPPSIIANSTKLNSSKPQDSQIKNNKEEEAKREEKTNSEQFKTQFKSFAGSDQNFEAKSKEVRISFYGDINYNINSNINMNVTNFIHTSNTTSAPTFAESQPNSTPVPQNVTAVATDFCTPLKEDPVTVDNKTKEKERAAELLKNKELLNMLLRKSNTIKQQQRLESVKQQAQIQRVQGEGITISPPTVRKRRI